MNTKYSGLSKLNLIIIFLGSITTAISSTMLVSAYSVLTDETQDRSPTIYQFNVPLSYDNGIDYEELVNP
jgi:hypothetical protein